MNVRNGIDSLTQTQQPQSPSTASAPKSAPAATGQTLSEDKAQVSLTASQIAQSSPVSDVRLDKVASIQAAIQTGTYHVSATDVAQKVITSMLSNDK